MPPLSVISVVIPAFNSATVIADALTSVQRQTFHDLEIIVVDNGSTDQTVKIVEDFAERDGRIKLFHEPKSSSGCARNTAARHASGEWLAFLDADDIWLPEKLASQLELATAAPHTNLLFTNFIFWDGQRDLTPASPPGWRLREGDTLKELIFTNLYLTSTVMLRRETFLAVGGFGEDLRYSQDWDLWLRVATHGLSARGLIQPLTRYRRWKGNVTNQRVRTILSDSRVVAKHLRANCRPELQPLYRRSLTSRRAELELARAALIVDSKPEKVRQFVWRAWRRERRLKWLRWYLRLVWPNWLGGRTVRGYVLEKIRRSWG